MNRTHCMLIAAVLASGLSAGCKSPRRRWEPVVRTDPPTSGAETVSTSGATARGSAREQLDQLDAVLRQQGFAPISSAVHGTLTSNGLVAYALEAQPGACYALTVIGEEANQNIALFVVDPAGRPTAHNVRNDNHPWASFCPSVAGRFIARVQMASGSGRFYYAAYRGPAGRRMSLAHFFGDREESEARTAQLDPETQRRLAELDRQLSGQGFIRIGQPMGLVLRRRSQRDFSLNLVNGQCYAFAALGGPGSVDTDVILSDSAGEQLEADTRRDRDAMIRHCASSSGTYSLQARMYDGEGSIFTVGYVRNAARTPVDTQQQPVIAARSTAGAGLRENFALLDADMRARGYESYGSQTTARLAQSGTRNFDIELEGGRCYAILAVGDAGVRDLDLVLLANGSEADRDIAEDARPTVRVCPRASGHFSMQVRMTTGEGSYVYAPYRWPRGTRGPFGLEGLSYVRLAEITALLGVEGFEPDPGFTPESGQLRRERARASHNLRLSAGQCYAIAVVGGDGVRDLDIALSRSGTLVANESSSRNAFPSVRHCAERDGRYSVDVTAVSGTGRYHVQVFSRRPASE